MVSDPPNLHTNTRTGYHGWVDQRDQPRAVDLAFVSDDASSNSLGRVYCLWLLSQHLGLSSVTTPVTGVETWGPLAHSDFAQTVKPYGGDPTFPWERWRPRLVVCVKPLPAAFFLAKTWARESKSPLVFDVDEPDIEAGLSVGAPVKRMAKSFLRPRTTEAFRYLANYTPGRTFTVSNPFLGTKYGGVVVPHVRPAISPARPPTSSSPVVAFIGTNRRHKGLHVLRQAVASVQRYGFRLVVTDEAPRDAKPWEEWIGSTTLSGGLARLGDSDIAVIPSLETVFSRGQLPVKLVDAMMHGRAIVASDLPPIRWALGGTGLLTSPGSVRDLENALRQLRDPATRVHLGQAARTRALKTFTVDVNAEKFLTAYQNVTVNGAN